MVVQRLKDQAPSAEGGVQSLVWELGSPHAMCCSQKIFFFKDVFLPSVIFYINFAFLFLLLNLYKVKFAFFLLNLLFSLLSVLLVLYTKRSVCVCVCVCVCVRQDS